MLARFVGEEAVEDDGVIETAADTAPTVDNLCLSFGLSSFERDVLLLCTGLELQNRFASACVRAHDGVGGVTFGLAMSVLEHAHWSATTPAAPLRYWRMVELEPGDRLSSSRIQLDERILHFLVGIQYLDARLHRYMQGVSPHELVSRDVVDRIAGHFRARSDWHAAPVVQLCRGASLDKTTLAAAAFSQLGAGAYRLCATDVPRTVEDTDTFIRLWQREWMLTGCGLVIDAENADPADERRIASLLSGPMGMTVVCTPEPVQSMRRPSIRIDIAAPTRDDQLRLWSTELGSTADRLDGSLQRVTAHFRLSPQDIQVASAELRRRSTGLDDDALGAELWQVCREQRRPRLEGLTQRIESAAAWEDLVLPKEQKDTLAAIATQVRHQARVHHDWGFAEQSARGLGITALFEGPSGTGKTMAAEVLARELDLDLFRIDLSAVVSKYIGETERNLRRVCDAAEDSGAVLLFDEADALFGKRSEVRDSHDRYANIEVSYLLQRIESFRGGVAILCTNAKTSIDEAFMRRLRFVIAFQFPSFEDRVEIWRRVFPAKTRTEGLDARRLAQLNCSGGSIRNLSILSAFFAAADDTRVTMQHVYRAACVEYAKLEKPLTPTETDGWL
jgi:hypothetical protein